MTAFKTPRTSIFREAATWLDLFANTTFNRPLISKDLWSTVQARVVRSRQKNEIVGIVIKRIVILVVHVFAGLQCAAQQLRHYPAVLQFGMTVNLNLLITISTKMARSAKHSAPSERISVATPQEVVTVAPFAPGDRVTAFWNTANFTRNRRRASFGFSHDLNYLSACG